MFEKYPVFGWFKGGIGVGKLFWGLNVDEFFIEMCKVTEEAFRVLKKGKMCAMMIGDVREYRKVIPVGFCRIECFGQQDL